MTFILLSTVITYGVLKYAIMKKYGDTNVQTSMKEYFYDDDDILSDSLGFNVAFGLSDFDGKPDFIEDPDYGTTKAVYRQWGFETESGTEVDELKLRNCTAADFGFDEDGNRITDEFKDSLTDEERDPNGKPFFFPPDPKQVNFIWTYHPKMHCFENKIKLQGEYDSSKARHLAIVFEKCDPKKRSTCKSETEIENWIKGKYIITIENTWTFRSYEF